MGNDDMDDASRTHVRALKLLAESIVRNCDEALDDLCARLVKYVGSQIDTAAVCRLPLY